MPSVTLNDIQLAVFERVRDASGLLPVKHQAKKFDDNEQPYAELIVSPMNTRADTVDGGDVMPGYILVNIYVPNGYGAFSPAEEGQKFINLFPRDFALGECRILSTGTIRSPVDSGKGWDYTPILIEYEADSCSQ